MLGPPSEVDTFDTGSKVKSFCLEVFYAIQNMVSKGWSPMYFWISTKFGSTINAFTFNNPPIYPYRFKMLPNCRPAFNLLFFSSLLFCSRDKLRFNRSSCLLPSVFGCFHYINMITSSSGSATCDTWIFHLQDQKEEQHKMKHNQPTVAIKK